VTIIDRNSPIPIYHQLETLLREQIETGLWRPQEQIPTEHELCRLHGISLSPVRQALRQLEQDGVLVRRPGLGTFVSNHSGNTRLSSQSSATTISAMILAASQWSRVLDEVAGAWNARYPDHPVAFQFQVVQHQQFYNLLSTFVGQGAAPDIALVDSVWVAALASSGFLYALEEQDAGWRQSAFIRNLYPGCVEANSFKGRLYGLPAKADVSVLWYRRDWFTQEGLQPPRDWNDLLETATYFLQPPVQERYGSPCALVFPGGTAGGEATVYNLLPFIWSAGGQVLSNGFVALDGPGTWEALRFLRELTTTHHVSPSDMVKYREYTASGLFSRGRAAMALGGSYEAGSIQRRSGWSPEDFRDRVGCVVPPAAPGRASISTLGGLSYVILRQCQHPSRVIDLLKMATDPSIVANLYRAMMQNPPSPAVDAWLHPGMEPMLANTVCMIPSGHPRPSVPEYVKVSRQLQSMFEAALSTTTPVEEITRRTAEFISVIIDRPCRTS